MSWRRRRNQVCRVRSVHGARACVSAIAELLLWTVAVLSIAWGNPLCAGAGVVLLFAPRLCSSEPSVHRRPHTPTRGRQSSRGPPARRPALRGDLRRVRRGVREARDGTLPARCESLPHLCRGVPPDGRGWCWTGGPHRPADAMSAFSDPAILRLTCRNTEGPQRKLRRATRAELQMPTTSCH